MAIARISDITTTVTAIRSDDLMELQSPSLGASGSANITAANLTGGRLLAFGGPAALNTASGLRLLVSFGATLSQAPSHVDVKFFKKTAAPNIPFGVVESDTITTTGFYLQMLGALSDATSYTITWRAYA